MKKTYTNKMIKAIQDKADTTVVRLISMITIFCMILILLNYINKIGFDSTEPQIGVEHADTTAEYTSVPINSNNLVAEVSTTSNSMYLYEYN